MVYRIYVEKKDELAQEALQLREECEDFLQIRGLTRIRVVNRYDAENISRELFDYAVKTVFSEPQQDITYEAWEDDGSTVFAVEYLPGQYDQRADSAAQCIQIISRENRPLIRTAKVYRLYGNLSEADIDRIKHHVINPVESREASLAMCDTLQTSYDIPQSVETVKGFCEMNEDQLGALLSGLGLAMDLADITFCRDYFRTEQRDPTITEIRVLDTYWSDHCRHTTFLTTLDKITFEDERAKKAYMSYLEERLELGRAEKPVNLMDLATMGARLLKSRGILTDTDDSEEINACTVKIKVDVDGELQDWLLLFKNETHNHPTEIEPFGGAATCIGGAIRDPLSGRAYVYGAMRVSGCGDPTTPAADTIPGKLPQRKLARTAAAGYSSYGNQIGLATGQVSEIYHDGYVAKHLETGAVIAAAPAENVRRETPEGGDIVLLVGGRTGRDGCGGATGSSKAHTLDSLELCGAEVQKGNAPEERKLQRLFRNPQATRMIKRCNDFGAGGVSVAIGELAPGLEIDLNAVPKKYDGLDGTELAISESQERMAVVVSRDDADRFIALAEAENLEIARVAVVRSEPRLVMWWNGQKIVDLSRAFLDTNGAEKHMSVAVEAPQSYEKSIPDNFAAGMRRLASDLNVCSQRGLSERFDSTIGAGSVLMPFGGKNQLTPAQAMVHKLPVLRGETKSCSLMSWGYNPYIMEKDPYGGAFLAVTESLAKLVATGADARGAWLTFQEYFPKPGSAKARWGLPTAALLGAYEAQKAYRVAAIGGKDSMSGSFETIDVPPTLISFAVAKDTVSHILSPEFKQAGHSVLLLVPRKSPRGLPAPESVQAVFDTVRELNEKGMLAGAATPGFGGVAEAVMKMSFGNDIGFVYEGEVSLSDIFGYSYGAMLLELKGETAFDKQDGDFRVVKLGHTIPEGVLRFAGEELLISELLQRYESRLESVFPCRTEEEGADSRVENISTFESFAAPAIAGVAVPKVLIPVFPGTNCEYDTARAAERAGLQTETVIIRNRTAGDIAESAEYFAAQMRQSKIICIPGGFSGGDEPDGSGKFITAFFRNALIRDGVHELLKNRDGLMLGICNGFQALIKLGLVPFGEIRDMDETCPTLTFNTIGRHQSRIVRTRVCSTKSPWLQKLSVGDVIYVPISHGEGRFIASQRLLQELTANGQIITQYADLSGNASNDILYNPNGSLQAVEGIISPDGRVLGKMGHSERTGSDLYINVPGNYDMRFFESAGDYYRL